MSLERQTSWGNLVALAMFLGGTGAGIYVAGFILGIASDVKWLAVTAMVLGPVLVAAGLLCLLLHAGSPAQIYRLFGGLSTAWSSRGGLVQVLFIVLGLVYALPEFWITGWSVSGTALTIGIVALILALFISTYHGLVLTEAKAIPLWSSSAVIPLSFFLALCTGLGLLLLISPVFIAFDGFTEIAEAMGLLSVMGIAYVLCQIAGLWSMMATHPDSVYKESARKIKKPVTVSLVCLLLSVLILFILLLGGGSTLALTPVVGLLLLGGGFITRYSILKTGYYIPLRVQVAGS